MVWNTNQVRCDTGMVIRIPHFADKGDAAPCLKKFPVSFLSLGCMQQWCNTTLRNLLAFRLGLYRSNSIYCPRSWQEWSVCILFLARAHKTIIRGETKEKEEKTRTLATYYMRIVFSSRFGTHLPSFYNVSFAFPNCSVKQMDPTPHYVSLRIHWIFFPF